MNTPTLENEDPVELPVVAYLRDLSERLMDIPVMYGTDGYDIDRLNEIARDLELQQMSE